MYRYIHTYISTANSFILLYSGLTQARPQIMKFGGLKSLSIYSCYQLYQFYTKLPNLKSKHTSNMVDRVESYPILANIERVFSFDAVLQSLNSLPVLVLEYSIICNHQSRTLVCSQVFCNERCLRVLSGINVEVYNLSSSVISILNQFLCKQMCNGDSRNN